MKKIEVKYTKEYHNPFKYKEVSNRIFYKIATKSYVVTYQVELEEDLDSLMEQYLEKGILINPIEKNILEFESESLELLQTI